MPTAWGNPHVEQMLTAAQSGKVTLSCDRNPCSSLLVLVGCSVLINNNVYHDKYSDFISHLVPSRNSSKAVQTQDMVSSLGFPTPPPAIADAHDYSEQGPDEYLSLKAECLLLTSLTIHMSSFDTAHSLSFTCCNAFCQQELGGVDRQAKTEDRTQNRERQKTSDKEKEKEKERDREKEQDKQQLKQEMNAHEEKAKRLRDGKDKSFHTEHALLLLSENDFNLTFKTNYVHRR